MSRLNEAMRRAGQGGAEDLVAAAADDSPFVDGEISVADVESEAEPTGRQRSLVRHVHALPVRATSRDSSPTVEIRDVIEVLLRRWKLICAVVIVSLSVAVAYNYTSIRIYEAGAKLLIEPDSPQVVPFNALTENTAGLEYIVTQLEVLRSRDLASRALAKLKLLSGDERSQANQISSLLGRLSVAPVQSESGDSRVINVRFRSEDPELAAKIANGLAQAYVDQNLEARREGGREAATWLNERLAELRREVTESASALQQYREQKDSVSLDDRQNIVVQKLAQLSTAVTTARTEKVQQDALYEQLNAIQKSGAPLDTFPPILSNSFIQAQKAELAGLQRQRAQLAERLGDLHPDMVQVDTAIAAAERRLNTEIDKVVEGIRNDYKAAEARERGLSAALEAQKRETLDLNQKAIGYGALQRDAASTQQIFDNVLQRLKEAELSAELQSNNARILDLAQVPSRPILPRTQLNLIAALLGGGFLAVGLVIGLEYQNPRIAKPDDVGDTLGLPLLGVTPKVAALKHGRPNMDSLPLPFQEALRSVRTRILLSPHAGTTQTLAVTSTSPGEGKSAVVSGLAVSMTTAGLRVLLIDADMRRPKVHHLFNIPASPGLSNVMAGEVKPSEALHESTVKGLFILPAGAHVKRPSDLLDSERLSALIQGFSQVFDVVLLDCPPVMAIADASIIANAAESVLFVVGAGLTGRQDAQAAVDRLTSVQGRVIGVVLNQARPESPSGYGNPYYESENTA